MDVYETMKPRVVIWTAKICETSFVCAIIATRRVRPSMIILVAVQDSTRSHTGHKTKSEEEAMERKVYEKARY